MNVKVIGVSLVALIVIAGVSWYVVSTNGKIGDLQSGQTRLRGELSSTETKLESTRDELSSTKIELTSTKQELESTKNDLASTRLNLSSTQESLLATRDDLFSTQTDLTATKGQLEQVRDFGVETSDRVDTNTTALSRTQRDLTSTQQNLSATRNSLEATQGDLASTQDDLASTKGDLSSTRGDLASTRRSLTSTQGELASTIETLSATQEDLDSTKASLSSTRTSLAATSRELSSVRVDLSLTNSNLAAVRADLDEIQETYGNIEALEAEVSSLSDEIDNLIARREPLVLETWRSSYACTGSMNPKIDCFDEGTYLENFRAEDIVVGSTISFQTVEQCNISGHNISHRVVRIKEVDDVYYFWPKGDANRSADNCWIPQHNVNGYLIEIHKGVNRNPLQVRLRESVQSAKKAVDDFCRRYGTRSGNICRYFEPHFSRATPLYNALECWMDVARDWYVWLDDEEKLALLQKC